MRVLTVIGNRPQFVKAAAVSFRLREAAEEVLVHTGQHYDEDLSQVFFDELELPRPEHRLDLGGGSNTEQTGRMLQALAPLLAREAPDAVLVYGDTNSTLAGALAGAQARIPVAHVEAGMRSFDRAMPEELNRVLAGPCGRPAVVLLGGSRGEPAGEGARGEVVIVGDVMVDVAQLIAPRAAGRTAVLGGLRRGVRASTSGHGDRAGNVRRSGPARAARRLARRAPGPVVLPLHTRARAHARRRRVALGARGR
jgi:UDP-N-acetylglucosamine 2-epimerase (non-hydrolysing)/UDP-GlcNAc3NAcA epimerase